jgi:hypothetical protein
MANEAVVNTVRGTASPCASSSGIRVMPLDQRMCDASGTKRISDLKGVRQPASESTSGKNWGLSPFGVVQTSSTNEGVVRTSSAVQSSGSSENRDADSNGPDRVPSIEAAGKAQGQVPADLDELADTTVGAMTLTIPVACPPPVTFHAVEQQACGVARMAGEGRIPASNLPQNEAAGVMPDVFPMLPVAANFEGVGDGASVGGERYAYEQRTDCAVFMGSMAALSEAPWRGPSPDRLSETVALPVTLSPREPTASTEPDTLRFTYQFQSWCGQPAATVLLGQSAQGRRLQIHAPDAAVFTALVAGREAIGGIVHLNDETGGERAFDEQTQQEPKP